jgi:hypothetical protein
MVSAIAGTFQEPFEKPKQSVLVLCIIHRSIHFFHLYQNIIHSILLLYEVFIIYFRYRCFRGWGGELVLLLAFLVSRWYFFMSGRPRRSYSGGSARHLLLVLLCHIHHRFFFFMGLLVLNMLLIFFKANLKIMDTFYASSLLF